MNIKTTLLLLVLCLLSFSASAEEGAESPFYGEIYLNDYQGGDGYLSQEAYFEYSVADTMAVWVNGYQDDWGHVAYTGLSKSWDNGWTVALGVGTARFEGVSQTVLAPWVSYSSEEWEFFLSGERYQGDEDPWFYQGYLQRYVGDHLVGVYTEKDFGIGPVVTWNFTDHLALRVAAPVADRAEITVLASIILTF